MRNPLCFEPAAVISVLGALVTLLLAFGVSITDDQAQAILGFATVLVPLVTGVAIRTQVSPAADTVTLEEHSASLSAARKDAKQDALEQTQAEVAAAKKAARDLAEQASKDADARVAKAEAKSETLLVALRAAQAGQEVD